LDQKSVFFKTRSAVKPRGLRLNRCGSLSTSNGQEKLACPGYSLSDQTVKAGLSGLIPVKLDYRKWLVRVKLCQIIYLKRSFVRLLCENQIMKVKFFQSDLQRLYCTSVVLSGKLFRIKKCLRLNSAFVSSLCKSKINQLVYSLHR